MEAFYIILAFIFGVVVGIFWETFNDDNFY